MSVVSQSERAYFMRRTSDNKELRIPMRQVVIYPGEDGYLVVECPSLPGCISQGATMAEAVTNIREAIQVYEEALTDDGLVVPEERFAEQTVIVCTVCRESAAGSAWRRLPKRALRSNGNKAVISFSGVKSLSARWWSRITRSSTAARCAASSARPG